MPTVRELARRFEALAVQQNKSLAAVTTLIETTHAIDAVEDCPYNMTPADHDPAYSRMPDDPAYNMTPGDPAYSRMPGDPAYNMTPGDPAYSRTPGDPAYSRTPGDRDLAYGVSPDDEDSAYGRSPASLRGTASRRSSSLSMPTLSELVRVNPGSARIDEHNQNFKRADAASLVKRFGVTIGSRMLRRGVPFDTKQCKDRYEAKGKPWGVGMARLGFDRNGDVLRPPDEMWFDETLIWVSVPNLRGRAQFFSNVGKLRRFHHSSFTDGGDVLGAGEWIVRNGRLIGINGNSGHYRPPIASLHRCVLELASALHIDTQVLLYHTLQDRYVAVPAFEFKRTGSKGGLYKAHQEER